MQHRSTLDTPANAALPQPKCPHAQMLMSGTGYVAVLPDGQCVGKLVSQGYKSPFFQLSMSKQAACIKQVDACCAMLCLIHLSGSN